MFEESIPVLMLDSSFVGSVSDEWLAANQLDSERAIVSFNGTSGTVGALPQFLLMTEPDPDLLVLNVLAHSRAASVGMSSSFFIAPDPGFGGSYHSSYAEEPPPGEGDEMVVVGKRPKNPVDDDNPNPNPGDPGTPGGGGNNTGGGGPDNPSDEQNDCADRAAMDAADDIRNDEHPDYRDESVSLIYRAADGSIRHTPVIPFDGLEIPYEAYDAILADNGISWSQVIGLVHNHPIGTNIDIINIGRYPTGNQAYSDDDWGFGTYAIAQGASDFEALYIIDAQGGMRKYEWADRDFFAALTDAQKIDGVGLPEKVGGCGSS